MLRSNHVLSLALLMSVSIFAMEQKDQLVVAAAAEQSAPAAEVAPSSALLSTVFLAENHKSEVSTLEKLSQQATFVADAQKVKTLEVNALAVKLAEKLTAKNKQIEGSTTTITTYTSQIEALKAKAAQDEAAIKAKAAQEESDLLAKISKEEEVKKTLSAEAAKLQAQIAPVVTEGSEQAPKTESKPWYRRVIGL